MIENRFAIGIGTNEKRRKIELEVDFSFPAEFQGIKISAEPVN